MHAVGVDARAAYFGADDDQARTGARRREDRERSGKGRDPGRTPPQRIRTGQLGDLLRRRERRTRPHDIRHNRLAEQHHQGGYRHYLRACRPLAVPRTHMLQHRRVHRHVRHRARQDSGRGRIDRRPRESRCGTFVQVLHIERGVAVRHHLATNRHSRAARKRHPRAAMPSTPTESPKTRATCSICTWDAAWR